MALLLAAVPAGAQPPGPAATGPPEVAAAAASPDGAVLVGPSGQVYHPGEPGTWTRKALGGVAADIRGALVTPDGRIFAAGPRTPLYRFAGGAWHAHPLTNRGSVVVARGRSAPALAVGRHVYLWIHGSWKRMAHAPGEITALWAASPGRVYAATRNGELARLQSGRWSPIRHPLAPGDEVSLLVSAPHGPVYAIAMSGAVLAVSPTRAQLVPRADELASFEPHAAAVDASGTLWIAGLVPAPPTSPDAPAPPASSTAPAPLPRAILAHVRDGRLRTVEPLPWVSPADRVTAIVSQGPGELLIATRRGVLRYRDTRGGWKSGTIGTAQAPRSPAGASAGPARTR